MTALTNRWNIPQEHFDRLIAATDDQVRAIRTHNCDARSRGVTGVADYIDACEVILLSRGFTSSSGFALRTEVAHHGACSHSDYDANGDCYNCGKHVARSVASYL